MNSEPADASTIQFLRHQFVEQRRVGLSLRRLHYLAYKESRHRFLAGAILLDLFGVGGNHLIDHRLDRCDVGKLQWLLPFVDSGEVLAPFKRHIEELLDRKSTRLNSSHRCISYAVFCLK